MCPVLSVLLLQAQCASSVHKPMPEQPSLLSFCLIVRSGQSQALEMRRIGLTSMLGEENSAKAQRGAFSCLPVFKIPYDILILLSIKNNSLIWLPISLMDLNFHGLHSTLTSEPVPSSIKKVQFN